MRTSQFPVLRLLGDEAGCDNHLYFYSSVLNTCFCGHRGTVISSLGALLSDFAPPYRVFHSFKRLAFSSFLHKAVTGGATSHLLSMLETMEVQSSRCSEEKSGLRLQPSSSPTLSPFLSAATHPLYSCCAAIGPKNASRAGPERLHPAAQASQLLRGGSPRPLPPTSPRE